MCFVPFVYRITQSLSSSGCGKRGKGKGVEEEGRRQEAWRVGAVRRGEVGGRERQGERRRRLAVAGKRAPPGTQPLIASGTSTTERKDT